MTTVAIPAEGLVKELLRTEKHVLKELLMERFAVGTGVDGGGTIRTLVCECLDSAIRFRYTYHAEAVKEVGITNNMRVKVDLVLFALRRLEQLGLVSITEADSNSKTWRYHENISPILASVIDKALDQAFNEGIPRRFGPPPTGLRMLHPELEDITRSEIHLTPEGKTLAEFILRTHLDDPVSFLGSMKKADSLKLQSIQPPFNKVQLFSILEIM